jgi:N4-gp56 family major capsid protein
MAGNLNTITTGTSSISPAIQTYYDKKLLREAKLNLVYNQFAQKRNIPRGNGKTVNFRKFAAFAPATTALVEGVTPDGGSVTETEITATVAQYGDYRTVSDVLDLVAIDPIINEIMGLNGEQAALTVDRLARYALTESADATNVLYAAGTQRSAIAKTDVLTTTLLRKAVRALKKAKAPKINGYYVAIVGPDTTFDLQADSNWIAKATYQDKEQMYSGEIGTIFGVKIVETTEAQIFEADDHILNAGTNITETDTLTTIASDAYIAATPSIQVTATATSLGSAGIDALVNKYIVIAGQRRKIAAAAAHSTPANGTILTLDAALTGVADKAAAMNSIKIYPAGGGITANPVAATVVLGKNAYGDIDIEGSKNVRSIVERAGGNVDPLHQRNTIGWKIMAYVCKILMPEWVLRIEHGISE